MNARAALAFPLVALALLGCNQDAVEVTQRSLQASSEVTFVCRGPDGKGLEQSDCPDYERGESRLFALVTQTATEEVAVVNAFAAKVVDVEPNVPGFSFLRMPSRPGDIVTTPGGAASFVGLTGVGKRGVAAIPTTCLGAATGGETARDLTTFPACRLPSVPGDMVVLVEPPDKDGIRTGCDPSSPLEGSLPPMSDDEAARCPAADLTREAGPAGRRKLAITLPERGEVVVLDAQSIVDAVPGSFEPCRIEASLPLRVDLDSAVQTLPPELVPDPGCTVPTPLPPPSTGGFLAEPAGVAASDGRLYIGDRGAPVVHVVDAASACHLTELPPLLPMSFEVPSRVVTASRVAVTPLTPSGKRFVYAIDDQDQPASVMAFDVSSGAADRTPIVRPGATRIPFEAPDRLRFASPVADLTFALRDLPQIDDEGVATEGVRCDPDPALSSDDPATLYRPSSDGTAGARPRLLRGLFGLLMLTSGQIVVIDVDDYDASCRRPLGTNASMNPDYRGCSGDVSLPPELTLDTGAATATAEVSCRMVEPHRPRAQSLGVVSSSLGVGAPSLRSLPRFVAPDSALDLSGIELPKLLAVNIPPADPDGEPVPPAVYVGTTEYEKGRAGADLQTNPAVAEESSLTLPFVEPRAHLPSDSFSLVYEGRVAGEGSGGFLSFAGGGQGAFDDPTAYFCGQGVYDLPMMQDYGEKELGLDGDELTRFAESHADYLQITDGFPVLEDSYWISKRGQDCGGRAACFSAFGRSDAKDLDPSRELTIQKAYQNRLEVRPRQSASEELAGLADQCTRCDGTPDSPECTVDGVSKDKLTLLFEHCFPGGMRYTVRASRQWVLGSSRGLHDVTARPVANSSLYECARDCNPRKRFMHQRVFEVSSNVDCAGDQPSCGVGVAPRDETVCAYDPRDPDFGGHGLALDDGASACIFDNLVARFVVYRGLSPSVRGMRFTWQTTGGFGALLASLSSQSSAVLPQHISYVPELQSMAVVDAASLGLSLLSLDGLRINADWPVY